MGLCKFERLDYRNRPERCSQTAFDDSPWCILHLDFPSEDDPKFTRIIDEKRQRTKEKIENGDFDFEGTKLCDVYAAEVTTHDQTSINFKNAFIKGEVLFREAHIRGDARFENAKITGNVTFDRAEIAGSARFSKAEIGGHASFPRARISEDVIFSEAEIRQQAYFMDANVGRFAQFDRAKIAGAWFVDATIGSSASFYHAEIAGDAFFIRAKIGAHASLERADVGRVSFTGAQIGTDLRLCGMFVKGSAHFDNVKIAGQGLLEGATIRANVWFQESDILGRISLVGATIGGNVSFDGAKLRYTASSGPPSSFDVVSVAGPFTFNGTQFASLASEEAAYRAAKQNCKNRGATAEANDYFIREMAARRRRKKQPTKTLELAIQYGLGYGARPSWLLSWWILIAVLGALLLSLATSNSQNLVSGFAAAFVPGYLIINGQSGVAELIAAILTVLNFFLWAAFIAVFSRKYID